MPSPAPDEPNPPSSRSGNPARPTGAPGVSWEHVHALFNEALDLDPPAREAFLARADRDDPEAAAQVRTLLDSHEKAGGFLDTPPDAALLRRLASGERLGPYRIEEEIGHGGMGIVYRAVRDDEHFQKEVAIKLIDPGLRSDEVLKRFRDERQILAMLDHPNIARLLDGGSAPDGSPFLVMEYVAGRPLLEYCDAKKLGVDERLRLFLIVCDAVQFAHQRLVVHRDLKSDNVLVTESGVPSLLDFGIAKLTSPGEGGAPRTVTLPMHRMMTPDYASPEQVKGEPVTVAGDVYSLGVILYELLTGTRPLQFETRTPAEVLRVVTQVEPAAPSTMVGRTRSVDTASVRNATVPRLRRSLAGDLDYIVLKALEKDPARRYGSVDQLSRDIRRYLEDLPVLARGRTTAYLLSRLIRRNRVAFVTGTIVALSLVAGLIGTTWQAQVASRERDRAKRRFEEVRSLAHAVLFDIHDAIANLPGSTQARETLVKYALLYLDGLAKEASDDPSLQHELGVAYGKIGDVQGRPDFPNLGRSADALTSYRRSLALLEAAAAAEPDSVAYSRDLALTMQRLGDLLFRTGRQDEALALHLDAKKRIAAELARYPDDPLLPGDMGVANDRISDMKFAAGDTVGALAFLAEDDTLIAARHIRKPEDAQARRSHMVNTAKMANLQALLGNRAAAEQGFHEAEALALECVRAQPNNTDLMRDLATVYTMRAGFLADGGEIDSALALYARGMAITDRLSAADPKDVLQQIDVANGHYEIGTILAKGRRHESAVTAFADAYARYQTLSNNDDANVDLRVRMARCSRKAGESCEALMAADQSPIRSSWRSKALVWYTKSLSLYRSLGAAGDLHGDEMAAPAAVALKVAALE